MSNFAFLRAQWPALHDETLRAERRAVADPRACSVRAIVGGNRRTRHDLLRVGRTQSERRRQGRRYWT